MTAKAEYSKLVSRNPANLEIIGETETSPPEKIREIVAVSKEASLAWRQNSLSKRLEAVSEFRRLLSLATESVSKLISSEMGKPFTEAMVSEVFSVLESCQWLEKKAEKILEPEPVELNPIFFAGKRSYNVFQALGVIAIISPWNYPFSIPAASALLALAAGNGVVIKPSPKTPLVAAALVELLERAGFPRGLVGLVQGDRLQAETLIGSGVSRVVFTGSCAGGKAIMKIAAENLVPVTLELGGKHAAIVLDDLDTDAAASGITWCSFTNAGQACASIDRLVLLKGLESTLLPKIVDSAKKLRMGDPLKSDTEIGPLVDESQFKRIQDLVEDARAKGASILCGGKARQDLGGYFYEPTIISQIKPEMRLMQEEIFGPLLPVFTVDSVKEGVEFANSSDLGLAASVWGGNIAEAESLARSMDAGVVFVNDGLFTHVCPDAPWGGVKQSGFGKAHSQYEILEMVSIKNIAVSTQGIRDWHFPYSENARQYIKAGIDLLHKGGMNEKWDALLRVLKLKSKLRS